ncbi:hypothetical protein K2O51_31480 (plasmid) [Cupriavidus pinatubonensis]|uniref:hypothetical protein n=1 Tax=Cupriavidus pinatubonensis TaxID=248026 RepID=UPI001C733F30|nr:hypothetical protein [Cupriavidus pinatubonensis]QYY33554.1 hypothetical protein K2O51_31480 [Cupriavidus pinatubonensis]
MRRAFAVLVAAVSLSGCALPPSESELAAADYGSYPMNYEEIIRDYMSSRLKDPFSAQYQFQNSPQRGFYGLGGAQYGFVVCALINAKNSYGGYTGARPAYFMIRDGAVVNATIGDGSYGDAMASGKCQKFVGKFGSAPVARRQKGIFTE